MFTRVPQTCQRWISIASQHGLRAAGQWLLARSAVRVLNLRVGEVVWLEAGHLPAEIALPAGYQFRFLTPDEIRGFQGAENQLDATDVARAQGELDCCFAALAGERLAAYGWFALQSVPAAHCDGVALSFPPDVAYMYKGFTHPQYRGRRLHGYVMQLALQSLFRRRGVKSLVSTVDWINWASLKSCDRLGYQRIGRMVSWGWGPLSGLCTPRAARDRGVRFGRHADLAGRRAAGRPARDTWHKAPLPDGGKQTELDRRSATKSGREPVAAGPSIRSSPSGPPGGTR
jgi:ribosomal protein S18 acetylase RimI-like enzyme